INLRDQTARHDLRILQRFARIFDQRQTEISPCGRLDPLRCRARAKDAAERLDQALLPFALDPLLRDQVRAPKELAGVGPELGLERPESEMAPVFGLVDVIAGITAAEELRPAFGHSS